MNVFITEVNFNRFRRLLTKNIAIMRCQQQLRKGIWLFSLYFLFALLQVKAQNGKIISGKVTDDTGKPVPSVTVQVKGTNTSTSAKNDGTFSIPVTTGNETLIFTSVGFSEKEVPLNGETSITVKLDNTKNTLEDVVV